MAAEPTTTPLLEKAVSVSVASLVKLSHPARGLSLRRGEIRSRNSDVMRSRMKGRGMEYDESRPYQPGDDMRYLDWRVTARTGKAHTKLFCEERERPVFLSVDCRASMFFATRRQLKMVTAAEIATLLAWSAVQEGDRVGGVVFSEGFHRELRPRRGRLSVLRLIHELAACDTPNLASPDFKGDVDVDVKAHSAGQALSHLAQLVHPGSLVFVISDFRDINKRSETIMRQLARHSEVFYIFISDPLEQQLPPPGDYRISDGLRDLRFNTGDAEFAEAYAESFRKRVRHWQVIAQKTGAVFLQCCTLENPIDVLKKNFRARL